MNYIKPQMPHTIPPIRPQIRIREAACRETSHCTNIVARMTCAHKLNSSHLMEREDLTEKTHSIEHNIVGMPRRM